MSLQAQHYSGVSSITGLPFPEKDLPGVRLDHALVQIRQLDTLAEYRMIMDLKNTTGDYRAIQMITPMRFYFNEFRPELRATILDRLTTLFPADFQVANPYSDTRQALKENFGRRLFIRKFVNTLDLAKLGIGCQAEIGDSPLSAKRIFIEFRWSEPERPEWEGTGQVLCMEVRVQHEVLIKPNDQRTVEVRVKLPSLITGSEFQQRYAPFELAQQNRWNDPIGQLFLVNRMHDATLVLPEGLSYRQFQEGMDWQVTMIENLSPQAEDRIAFFQHHGAARNCEVSTQEISFPLAVRNISASTWLDRDKQFSGLQVISRPGLQFAREIPEYEHLSGYDLTLLSGLKPASAISNPAMQRIQSLDCNRPEGPALDIKGYCHPVFAFDLGPEKGFQMQTAWCEDANGAGKGEFIRFELTQPARAMHMHNGYQFNEEKYKANSRVRTMTLTAEDGSFSQILPVTDLRILNLYDLELKPGYYKLSINSTYEGTAPTTCISSLAFDFVSTEKWFQQHFPPRNNPR